jgi:pilus assembly protein CpaF
MAELMRLLIKGERNIIYAGITGTGKTTSIRAILDHYVTSLNKRIIVCEETQELFLENDHTLDLVASKSDDKKSSITLYDLIITCLRLKPKYIVVGEVRAEEAEAAVEAMETGHSTIFTMHGGRPINCINRLVTKYLTKMPTLGIEVVERIIGSAVDYIWVQDNIPGIGRRVTEVAEVDYDFVNKCVRVTPIYKYDFKTNDFVLVNKIHPEKADLMLRRGVLYDEIAPWIKDEEERSD